ncbi:hypothetical protein Tco_0549116 [Tanacetum coccineum]
MDNIKIECMVGQFLKKQAYIDLESPINVMSRLNYYWIMSEGLKSRKKPSNPKKIAIFIGRVKGLKVFVGNFTYECDFVVLENTTSVIDHYLGGMVLGKPFVKETGLVYDKDDGMGVTNRIACRNFFQENECEIFIEARDGVRIILDGVRSPACRKAYLLEDKQIPSVWVFDEVSFYTFCQALEWILEEIHVTWAHLEKKQTRLRLYTKSLEEIIIQMGETASPDLTTASELDQDGVRSITTVSECSRLK